MKTNNNQIRSVWNYISKLATAIVSGLPRKKVVFKPETQTIIPKQKNIYKPDSEKHYHRPKAKPAVEKQTLLKENKKTKTVH